MTTATDRIVGLNGFTAWKPPARVATTANITLSGEQTIDGVAVVAGDRVLVKDQTTGADNGIYVAATGTWTRATDFNGTRDVVQGTQVHALSGTSNGGTDWRLDTASPTIGSSSLTFTARNASPVVQYSTRALIAATTFSTPPGYIQTAGYAAVGDGGAGLYEQSVSEPSHEGKVRSLDGQWWELVQDARGANPLQFGADPTAATASDTAFVNCWAYAITKAADSPSGVVMYIPPGDYLLTTGNILGGTSQTFTVVRGHVHGAGGASILRFKPTSAAKFSDDDVMCALFDGGTTTGTTSTLKIERSDFRDFTVLLDGSDATLDSDDTVMFVRNYQSNGWQFHNIEVNNANTYDASGDAKIVVYESQGTSNGAEMQWYGCEFRRITSVGRLKNPQAVNHAFRECNVALCYGHFFEIDGGTLPQTITGGNWLWNATPDVTGYTGTHDGSGNASALTDTGASFPTTGNGLVGCKIKNTTDGSEGFVTANTATTVTATLSGGTDNDWDVSDAYTILPPQCLFEVIDGSGMGSTNHTCEVTSFKPELRADEQSALVRNTTSGSLMKIFFRNINFAGGGYTGTRSMVTLAAQQSVIIEGGEIPDDWHCMVLAETGNLGTDTWTRSGQGLVWIDRAGVSADLSESVTFKSNADGLSAGRFVVTNSLPVVGNANTAMLPVNFERNAGNLGAMESNFGPFEFTMVPFRNNVSAGKVYNITLPYGARLNYAYFELPGAGADATSRDHVLADGDGTLDTYSGAENADLFDASTFVGTSANKARTTANERALSFTPDGSLATARRGCVLRLIYTGGE